MLRISPFVVQQKSSNKMFWNMNNWPIPSQIPPRYYEQREIQVKVEEPIKIEENNEPPQKNDKISTRKLTELQKNITKLHKKYQKKFWTCEEDELLLEKGNSNIPWKEISKLFQDTNSDVCKRRYIRLTKQSKKWPEELDAFVLREFEGKKRQWKQIALDINTSGNYEGRYTGSVVRDRYCNHLREGIKRKPWNETEDQILCQLVSEHGNVWSKFIEHFDGKTELQLKNRWHGILKPIVLDLEKGKKNRRMIRSCTR